MSAAWSQSLDVDRLSDGQAEIDFAIPLPEFARLPAQPAGSREAMRGRVRFGRREGFAVAWLELQGAVVLECQRCLTPMPYPVRATAQIALVANEDEAARVPQEFEPVRMEGGRVRIRDLAEEELLLAIPIAPVHEDVRQCAQVADESPAAEDEMQRPFERLGELLKRKQ